MSQKTAIEFIKKHDDFAIIFDFDPDGMFSAAIILKILKSLNKTVVFLNSSTKPDSKNNLVLTRAKKFKNVITLDLAFSKKNLKIFNNNNVLMIDHHETDVLKDYDNVIVLKHDKIYTPNSKLVYDLGISILGKSFEKYDWLGVCGTIADYGGPQHGKWIEKVLKKYGLTKKKSPYFNTTLGQISNILNCARIVGGEDNAKLAIKSLVKSKDYDGFLKADNLYSKKIHSMYDETNEEIESELDRFETKKQKHENRTIFLLKDKKFNIRSTLSTILSSRMEKGTLCICEERSFSEDIHGSFRSKDENVLKIIEKLEDEISITGGGHQKAAGFKISKTDFPRFKELYLNK